MHELVSVLMEETNEVLLSNSTYNVSKSNLFRLFKERESTVEMLWQKIKEDAHKKFIIAKRKIEADALLIKSSNHTKSFISDKIEEYKTVLEQSKDVYKETIRIGAKDYQTNYDELLKRFESELEELRESTLRPKQTSKTQTSLEQSLIDDYNSKKTKMEEHFNKKWTLFKGKVSHYNKLVTSFKKEKSDFIVKAKKIKREFQQKEQELSNREDRIIAMHLTLKQKEVTIDVKERELEEKRLQNIKRLNIERESISDERQRMLDEIETQRTSLDDEFIKIQQLQREAEHLLISTKERVKKETFWENFKINADALKCKMQEEREKRLNRNNIVDPIVQAEDFFMLTTEYTLEDLRKIYKRKLQEYHPDKHYTRSEAKILEMKQLFQKTQEMYEILKYEFVE